MNVTKVEGSEEGIAGEQRLEALLRRLKKAEEEESVGYFKQLTLWKRPTLVTTSLPNLPIVFCNRKEFPQILSAGLDSYELRLEGEVHCFQ